MGLTGRIRYLLFLLKELEFVGSELAIASADESCSRLINSRSSDLAVDAAHRISANRLLKNLLRLFAMQALLIKGLSFLPHSFECEFV